MIGNRGVVNGRGHARWTAMREFATIAWIVCELETQRQRKMQRDDNRSFNGRKRVIWSEGRWTELFFLDEVTALAAGHRPCGCCRHKDYKNFVHHWKMAHKTGEEWNAGTIDAVLHAQRRSAFDAKPTLSLQQLKALPNGAMVAKVEIGNPTETETWLLWDGQAYKWGHGGYGDVVDINTLAPATLATPEGIVATIRAGWEPRTPAFFQIEKYIPSKDLPCTIVSIVG